MNVVKLYTLRALAEKEQTSYDVVRTTLERIKKKDGPLQWRGWQFVQAGRFIWLAHEIGAPIEIIDSESER